MAALLDERRRVASPDAAESIGRVLLHFAATDAAFVFRPAWLDVARQVDADSRRELIARAVSWVARGYANGRFTIGAFADACVVAGAEGAEHVVSHRAGVVGVTRLHGGHVLPPRFLSRCGRWA